MSEEREREPAREAAEREAAIQAIRIAALVISVLIVASQRHLTEPDFWRGLRMSAAKRAERFWATLAAGAWRRAERHRLAYEAERGAP